MQQTTTLLDPAKAYAKGVGNAAPDIPDPIARHTTDGLVKLKVSTSSASSVWSARCLAPPVPALSPWATPLRLPIPHPLPRQPHR